MTLLRGGEGIFSEKGRGLSQPGGEGGSNELVAPLAGVTVYLEGGGKRGNEKG